MKVEIVETLKFPPEIIFAVLTDIPHRVDWVEIGKAFPSSGLVITEA